jgi:hypothetical protein
MVVGMHGRKGLKSDPTVLGSAVQYLSVNAVCPVLMVKKLINRADKAGGKYRWAVLSDGSEKSLKSLHVVS